MYYVDFPFIVAVAQNMRAFLGDRGLDGYWTRMLTTSVWLPECEAGHLKVKYGQLSY